LVDTYLNGGSMRWYWKSLFHYANQMISRARIARNHKHAAELQSVFDRLFTGKKLEPLEAFAIHKAVHDHYEFLVDDH